MSTNRIKLVDLKQMSEQADVRRKLLMNGPRFHTWLHVYNNPGEIEKMHCHNADQIFYCIEGECTMHFPGGAKEVLKPGMVALIPGGSFYELENSGTGKLVMLGARSLSDQASKRIDYVTRQEVKIREKGEPPKATQILV